MLPEFLGDRSPFADPEARAVIAGLDMVTGMDGLVALYIAGLFGLGYGVRRFVAALRDEGISIDTLVIGGGAGQSDFVRQLLADAMADGIRAEAARAGASITRAGRKLMPVRDRLRRRFLPRRARSRSRAA